MKKLICFICAFVLLISSFSIIAFGGDLPIIPIPSEDISINSDYYNTTDSSTLSNDDSKFGTDGVDFEEKTEIPDNEISFINIKSCKISGIKNKTYTGKAVKQSPTVKYGNTTLAINTDYTVSYKNNKAVGTATVTIKGKGRYSGTFSKNFSILPNGTSIKKISPAGSKKMKINWKKQTSQTSGYQIQYSVNKNFKKSKKETVKKNKTVSKTVKGLKKGKKYYVRIRTFKTVGGKKYYSSWSKAKTIKIKN